MYIYQEHSRHAVYVHVAGLVPEAVRHACHADLESMYRISQEGNIEWSLGQLQVKMCLLEDTVYTL